MNTIIVKRTERRPQAWSTDRARAFLATAHEEAARGNGISDRTLARMAALLDPEAPQSRDTFETSLRRAGWGKGRILLAVAEVMPEERPAVELVICCDGVPMRDRMLAVLRDDGFQAGLYLGISLGFLSGSAAPILGVVFALAIWLLQRRKK